MRIRTLYHSGLAITIALLGGISSVYAQKAPKFTDIVSWSCTPVKDQGKTGTCWSFSTASFIESEFIRMGYDAIDISEMYIVRNIYLEKAERYVRKQGTSNFSQGALAHDLMNAISRYGMMPESAYSGKPEGKAHDHEAMEKELKSFLDSMVQNKKVLVNWKDSFNRIMDRYMGAVPKSFKYYDQMTDPINFMSFFSFEPSSYIGLTSFTHRPYNSWYAIEVPDNFSEGAYYNMPLDAMFHQIDEALKSGYTISWDGDVSEKGFSSKLGVAVLAELNEKSTWPIKEPKVTAEMRQEAFDTYATTDDHLMHIVGLAKDESGNKFYKVKNSWGEKSGINGYMYMSEAYMKMKTVAVYMPRVSMPKTVTD